MAQIEALLTLVRQPGCEQEVDVRRATGFVAPVAESGLEHVVTRGRRIQTDDLVGAESTLQYFGPNPT